jgi:pimeloyl-ACP methyl ester carboxylesterase
MPATADAEVVRVDGRRVAFRQLGSGPPLVMLHGAVSDSRVWIEQLELLGTKHRVIAWDAPGCGDSPDPPEHWRLPEYADCLHAFVDALGLVELAVLGHSWGSALALQLAARHPRSAGRLVLVGAYAGWAGSLPADEVDRRLAFALETADGLPAGFEPGATPGLFSDRMPASATEILTRTMRDIRPAATRAMAYALAEADLRAALPGIAVPTFVLCGDADLRSPLAVGEDLHRRIPGSELAVIPGAGHMMFLEDPRAFAVLVTRFLARTHPDQA